MARYSVVGIKRYSSELQNTLHKLCTQDLQELSQNKQLRGRTEQQIEMFSINPTDRNWNNEMNEKHGEHSHYMLFNDNAVQLFSDYGYQLDIIDRLELDDPMAHGCILNIRNYRFV